MKLALTSDSSTRSARIDIAGVLEHLTSGPAVTAENPDDTEIG
ncbi:hypothetical protein [Mycolicibacterium elephantis]